MRTNASDFLPLEKLECAFGDPKARGIALVRHPKTLPMEPAVECTWTGTTERVAKCAIIRLKLLTYTLQTR